MDDFDFDLDVDFEADVDLDVDEVVFDERVVLGSDMIGGVMSVNW